MLSRRHLAALALAAAVGPAATAQAGPRRAQFTYTFKATQQSAWSYDNRLGPSECQQAPASGGGTQSATFTDKGKVEVTSDLARNVKKANFNISIDKGKGVFQRQGGFAIAKSQRGSCAEPDLTLGTQGCGADTTTLFGTLLYTGGKLETSGKAVPFRDANGISCPFFFYSFANAFQEFQTSEPLDNDVSGGMLGTTERVGGAQFFKRKTVVLKGGRTQKYQPTGGGLDGFVAQSTISYKLTLKPKR